MDSCYDFAKAGEKLIRFSKYKSHKPNELLAQSLEFLARERRDVLSSHISNDSAVGSLSEKRTNEKFRIL
jgi:hypothetical protein